MHFSARPKTQDDVFSNGESSSSKKKFITIDDVLRGLVEWLCAQVCVQLGMDLFYLSFAYLSLSLPRLFQSYPSIHLSSVFHISPFLLMLCQSLPCLGIGSYTRPIYPSVYLLSMFGITHSLLRLCLCQSLPFLWLCFYYLLLVITFSKIDLVLIYLSIYLSLTAQVILVINHFLSLTVQFILSSPILLVIYVFMYLSIFGISPLGEMSLPPLTQL